MKRRLRVAVAVFVALLPAPTLAWGRKGHMVIAAVAAKRLSPKARHAVAQLLPGTTLAAVANWADDIRDARPETERWHFVDIPLPASAYDPARDCRPTAAGDCVVAATERSKRVLADATRPKAERAEALKFLVHFVADLHQPLHCADNHDNGGNDVKVTFFRQKLNPFTQKPWNLHSVWDSGIIEETGLSVSGYVKRLNAALASADSPALQGGTLIDWALEAHRAAAEHAYEAVPPTKRLAARYFNANRRVVDKLLAKAGVRLARVLNDAFAP